MNNTHKVYVGVEEGTLRSLLAIIDGEIHRISIAVPGEILDYLTTHLPLPSHTDRTEYTKLSKGKIVLEPAE